MVSRPVTTSRRILLVLGASALLNGCAPTGHVRPAGAGPSAPAAVSISEACRNDLASRLEIEPARIEVLGAQDVVWPDSALGLDRPGEVVAQARTPGERLVLRVKPKMRDYVYAAAGGGFRYGGPLDLWKASALTVEDVEGDPNLNGRLVQYSLIGTNRSILLEGVEEVYPQENGSLFATRRTSRSGHELLYAAPGRPAAGAARIAAAFDFLDAVVSPDGALGAVIARTGPGPAWELEIVRLSGPQGQDRRFDMPEGVKPGRVRWSDGDTWPKIVLMGERDGKPVRFGVTPLDASPRWESLPSYVASDEWDFVLSKSHSLAVYETDLQGRPAVKVEYVWWNRAPEEIATIPGLKLDGFRWAAGREFVFIGGRTDAGHAGLTVDIDTGEVLTAVTGASRPVKLFKAPPRAPLSIVQPSSRD